MASDRPTERDAIPDPRPASRRLSYRRLSEPDLEHFHRLATDAHIRRFLMDGQVMTPEWSAGVVRSSDELFATHGVGMWVVFESGLTSPIGFCGYRVFEDLGPEPQLLYALREPYTGRGYATEIARALVDFARRHADFGVITAAVDGPNVASTRVLQKAGFRVTGHAPGAFGTTVLFALPDRTRPG